MTTVDPLKQRQVDREATQRQAALGRRLKDIQEGHLGPVIKRWINASVQPVADRLVLASEAYLRGDIDAFCSILDSPVFELRARDLDGDGSRSSLHVIFRWLEGPGIAGDIVLAALGTVISQLATGALRSRHGLQEGHGGSHIGAYLTGLLAAAGEAARETALGQFFTTIQGAETMQRIRRPDRSAWSQRSKLNILAAVMRGQVKPQLDSEARGEVVLEHQGTRAVLKIMTSGHERMVTLRPPTIEDWDLLEVARRSKGEADPHRPAWMTFALVILCAAQVEHGWFDLIRQRTKSRRPQSKAHTLILSDEAYKAMKGDLDRWIHLGFTHEPMLVEPEGGDYLTVKHRPVAGRRGPMGIHTDAEGTTAWEIAGEVMAKTPWQVAGSTLEAIKTAFLDPGSADLWELALKSVDGDHDTLRRILGAYSRDASENRLYLPIYMDFRGRVYPRSSWVTYQGTDVQKGLLHFTDHMAGTGPVQDALILHMTNLAGHGLDKLAMPDRRREWDFMREGKVLPHETENPIQFFTAMGLWKVGRANSIPTQIDGTCNGLQHLSALFRDETAAPWVNLTGSSYNDKPMDIYGRVAEIVMARFEAEWKSNTWMARILKGNIRINRKVCKSPVMVLPYGGTLNAIIEAVTKACLDQEPIARMWLECLTMFHDGSVIPDMEAQRGNYQAFHERALADHPLFHADMTKLAQVIHEAIKLVIPRAMAAMDAFRAIAGHVGDRTLEWSTGFGENPLWVVHAYPVSARSTLKTRGFHLPNSVRGLQMRVGKDEVDRHSHRTGIVANFIHSMDGAHLARTMAAFKEDGGKDFGAVHDCFITRPSQMGILNRATRDAFNRQYGEDPLTNPVRCRSLKDDMKLETWPSWYAMAADFGVSFPDMGLWKPSEVLKSAWFFS